MPSKNVQKITWFKVLTPEGREPENETKSWDLPQGTKAGSWVISGARTGTLLVANPKSFLLKTNRVFVAQLDVEPPIITLPGLIWVRKARLVREATNLDLKPFGIHRVFQQII